MKRITINPFDARSIQSAIDEVERYGKWIEEKKSELCKRLADIGYHEAIIRFNTSNFEFRTGPIDVRIDDKRNGVRLIANGNDVCFIEFGTGMPAVGYPGISPTGNTIENTFGGGTWSDGPNGKHHWNQPHGWYDPLGRRTKGNEPAMAMWFAEKRMVEQIGNIAREVFGND